MSICHQTRMGNFYLLFVGLKEGLQLTGVAMVNLREQRGLQVI